MLKTIPFKINYKMLFLDLDDETDDMYAYLTDPNLKLEKRVKFREFVEFKKFIDELSIDYVIKPVAGYVDEKNNEPQVKFLIVVLFKKPVASDTQYATPVN
ncbi:hypothetical protein [Sulfolobus tengchongensis spindle-shaped virus 3]|nr:hypothetical protein [Sulfolobus tengchongensis spindle-shaped virus 3]